MRRVKTMNDTLFANGKVSKVFIKFAVPSVLTSLLMISTYLVDGVLIGQFIGAEGLAAFNLVFPIFSFLSATAIVVASGGSASIGKYLGQNNQEKAKQVFNLSIIVTILFAVLFSGITITFADMITLSLGATDLLFEHTKEYFTTLALFFVLFLVGIVLQFFIRNEGNSIYPIKATAITVIINVPLTYLFLAVLNMGLGGAALATGISLIASTVLMILYFLKKNTILSYGKPIFSVYTIKKILFNGASEGLSEFSVGIVILIFNLTLIQYIGQIGIAAFAIVSLTSLIVLMINVGLSMALQPMVSYNYGAKTIKRVNDTLKIALKVSIVIGVVFYIVISIFGDYFIALFADEDEKLASLTLDAIRIYGLSYIFIGVNLLTSAYLTALEKPKVSLVISMSYNFIFVTIALIVFPMIFGASSIWWAVPFANMITIFISVYFMKLSNRKFTEIVR